MLLNKRARKGVLEGKMQVYIWCPQFHHIGVQKTHVCHKTKFLKGTQDLVYKIWVQTHMRLHMREQVNKDANRQRRPNKMA